MGDTEFKRKIRGYWRTHGRHELPWRHTTDPYAILVSEVMLQQTQVDRVIPFYEAFLKRLPTFRSLARARQASVLKTWQGLGYNRRALNLQRCARVVVGEYGGALPNTFEQLRALPGIGPYTAGAILAFAFNKPHAVIETNIRRIYLHHYFRHRRKVADSEIFQVVERTMDRRNPRRWFSALMDYGTYLAGEVENPNRRSRHYRKQSQFNGSDRQLRAAIVRRLLSEHSLSEQSLLAVFDISSMRMRKILDGLKKEGFIKRHGNLIRCA